MRNHGFRDRTTRQPHHESLDATAVTHPLTQHASHAVARPILEAGAVNVLACGANGHGRLTAGRAATLLFLAVALQFGIAVAVSHIRMPDAPPRTVRATGVHQPLPAALAMGHLVYVRVCFSKISPADPLSA